MPTAARQVKDKVVEKVGDGAYMIKSLANNFMTLVRGKNQKEKREDEVQ